MAEAIVSVVLQQLASILVEQAEAGVKLVLGVEHEVQKLTSNFIAIKAVLEDAENRQVKENAVRVWLDKLKDTSYDILDALDEWNTAIRKLHLNKIENAFRLKRKVRSLIPVYRFSPRRIVLRRGIASKIKKLNKTLHNIAREKDMFSFSLMTKITGEVERQTTTSVIDQSKVHGRDEHKSQLVELLLNESSHGVPSLPIISIIGMGGVGKTTLARLIYHDNRVNTHFEKKIWVCVSSPFNEIRIARAILESIEGVASNLVELENILQKIRRVIENTKFLLVLDDVWTEDPNKWEQLMDNLKFGCQGSRVLLTTRKENVAKVVGTTNMFTLGKLSEEDCWSLFSQVALSRKTCEECEKLEGIGRKIVSKCKGLPLAVKTLGSLLALKTRVEQWERVLDSEMWKLEEVEKGLFAPLLLSYYDLSPKLRKCFSYCAIFPKDCNIEKDKLIKLWMAQGYLNVDGREDMELVGEECFENLAMHSFFQDFEKDEDDGSIISCKMHDIVHDFAQFLTKNECLTIEVDDAAESELEFSYKNSRHSMIILKRPGVFPISIYNETKLHSLLVKCDGDYLTENIISELWDKLKCLRTIEFSRTSVFGSFKSINKISGGIEKLMHLRYLSFRFFEEIKGLPESLCDLVNLETLDLHGCYGLEKLPKDIGKLINLRHLIISYTYSLRYMPKGMEKLTCLRTLSEFKVSGVVHGSKACTLECLGKLKYLQGSVKFFGLGNVTDVDQVKKADLKSKKNLLHLVLFFGKDEEVEGRINEENKVILEAIELPSNLKKLKIWGYKSKTMSTDWMVPLNKLTRLELGCINELKNLPCLGQLPSLESLRISEMKSVRRVGNELLGIHHHHHHQSHDYTSLSSSSNIAFPKLKSLTFHAMDKWEEWDFEFMGEEEDIIIMPCLRTLCIFGCHELKSVPGHLLQKTTLEKLVICDCTNLEKLYKKGEDWHKISRIPDVQFFTSNRLKKMKSI